MMRKGLILIYIVFLNRENCKAVKMKRKGYTCCYDMLTVLISDCRVSIVGKFLFTHGHWNIFAIYLFRPQKWWWWFQSKLVESKILNIQMNKIRCVFATDTGLTGWGIKKVLALNVAIAKVNMIFPSNFFHSFGTFKCWSGHMYMTNWPPSFFCYFQLINVT